MDWWWGRGVSGRRRSRRSFATLQWSCSRPPPAATAGSTPTFITAEKAHTHRCRPECQRSWRCGKGQNVRGNVFALHQRSLVAVFMPTEAYFCPAFSTFAGRLGGRVFTRGGLGLLCRLFNTAFPCCAVAKGQRVKRLLLKAFCSLGPKGSFVPRHQPS